jgi:hypothetical protein
MPLLSCNEVNQGRKAGFGRLDWGAGVSYVRALSRVLLPTPVESSARLIEQGY